MLTADELYKDHSIYWSAEYSLYRREKGGESKFGLRTDDIFGDNIYNFPELYIPSRANMAGENIIYTVIDGTVCICGCNKCKNLYIMRHIESGKEFAVGSSCIKKAKGHLLDKYKEENKEIDHIKNEYKKFDNYLKDLVKPRCAKCYDLMCVKNRKPHKKNITVEDYCDKHPYCYKCDDRYENNSKCINCDDRIVLGINTEFQQARQLRWAVCSGCVDCLDNRFKFYFNISYGDKDKYKQKYNTKWDATAKKWYLITTFRGLDDYLKNLILSVVKKC